MRLTRSWLKDNSYEGKIKNLASGTSSLRGGTNTHEDLQYVF